MTRVSPIPVRVWRRHSEKVRRGLMRGLGSSGPRTGGRAGRTWRSGSGRRCGRRCVVLRPRANPTAVSRWGTRSERVPRGVGSVLLSSERRRGGRVGRMRCSGRRCGRRCVVLKPRVSPTPVRVWRRHSEKLLRGVMRGLWSSGRGRGV